MNKAVDLILKGAKAGTKNFVLPAIDTLIVQRPDLIPVWIMIKGYFGTLLDLQQERVNEFVEYIRNNEKVFAKEIVNTKDFRDGFVITFGEYVKQRNEEKRKVMQQIFLGFTGTKDKVNFELERMYDLLNKLSHFHLHLLKKIDDKEWLRVDADKRDIVEYDYSELKYLEYLGLVVAENKKDISVEESTRTYIDKQLNKLGSNGHKESIMDYDIDLDESDTFTLSLFGEEFIKFVQSDN